MTQSQVVFMLGSDNIDSYDFIGFAISAASANSLDILGAKHKPTIPLRLQALINLQSAFVVNSSFHQKPLAERLLLILHQTANFAASDPKDKLYALCE